MEVHLETGVAMAYDDGDAAWIYDLAHWGRCGQGRTEADALADLARQTALAPEELKVVQRVAGDEQAFGPDLRPATGDQRAATLAVLRRTRAELMAWLGDCPPELLDARHQGRELPSFARWHTLREMAWHIADTESRYYLPRVGLAARPRAEDLMTELTESAAHVSAAVQTMPADLLRREGSEVWTSVKVLRRLAWRERGELVAMRALAAAATSSPRPASRGRPGCGNAHYAG